MLNREQRRAYQKKIKKNSAASICPVCNNKALFYTTRITYPSGEQSGTIVKCQVCDATIREGEEVNKLVPPGITLPVSLAKFDQALLWEAEHPREEKKDEQVETASTENEGETAGEQRPTQPENSE